MMEKYLYYRNNDIKIFQIYEYVEMLEYNKNQNDQCYSYKVIYSNDAEEIGIDGHVYTSDHKENGYVFSNNLEELMEQFMLDIL